MRNASKINTTGLQATDLEWLWKSDTSRECGDQHLQCCSAVAAELGGPRPNANRDASARMDVQTRGSGRTRRRPAVRMPGTFWSKKCWTRLCFVSLLCTRGLTGGSNHYPHLLDTHIDRLIVRQWYWRARRSCRYHVFGNSCCGIFFYQLRRPVVQPDGRIRIITAGGWWKLDVPWRARTWLPSATTTTFSRNLQTAQFSPCISSVFWG